MAFSSGTKTAIGEAASWLAAAAIMVTSFIYFDELKSLLSPLLPADSAIVATARPGSSGAPQQSAVVQTVPQNPSAGYTVELNAGPYGHYKTPARVNGREINVLVDTGASYVALTYEDAARGGVYVTPGDFKHKTQTANGTTRVALINIDRISIGDIIVRDVRATVHERGKLHVSLLGMSFLGKLRRTEMRGGRLILEN